jgi:catechol 2,3-dioxygenase
MNLPQTNFRPPFNVTRASHLVLTSRDLAKARDFYTEVIGLKVSDETATTIHLRGVEERAHHSLTLKRTKEEPACERIGFRVFEEEDLERAKAHFERSGIPAKFVNVPFQGRTLHMSDTAGTPLEFCARMKTLPRMQTRTHEHKGAGALRMDHFQVLTPDVASAASFYTELGFRVSDYYCAAADRIIGIFMHRKDNPHDMVFLTRAGPRFHHFGYIVPEMHHVVRALDCAGNLGFGENIEHGPGRHGHGHSYYVYLRDPDGHRLELLLPAVQVIDIDDEPTRYDMKGGNTNLWGLPPPRSWFEECSLLTGAKVTAPDVQGEPLTLEKYLFGKGQDARVPDAAQRHSASRRA